MAVSAAPGTSIDTTVVNVRPQPAVNGSCDLCARPPGELPAVVQVQQTSGATTFLRSCAYCARALRRIGAVSRGLIRLVDGDSGPQTMGPEIGLTEELLRRAEAVFDYAEPYVVFGVAYRVRAMGAERHDGTWVGWLEFHPRELGRCAPSSSLGTPGWADPAAGLVRRTDRETTQPNRTTLVYWASGVQPSYLRGAYDRARETRLPA